MKLYLVWALFITAALHAQASETSSNHWAIFYSHGGSRNPTAQASQFWQEMETLSRMGFPRERMVTCEHFNSATPAYVWHNLVTDDILAAQPCNLEHLLRGKQPSKFLSDSKSKVFVYIAQRSGSGEDTFDWGQVERAARHMTENNLFDELVLYMNLPGSEKVFRPLFQQQPRVYAISRRNVLSLDNFSGLSSNFDQAWLEHTAMCDVEKTTLAEQFGYLHERCNGEGLFQMGDLRVADQTLAHFFGIENVSEANWTFPTQITSAYDAVIDNTKRYVDRFVKEEGKLETKIIQESVQLGTQIQTEASKMAIQFTKETDKLQAKFQQNTAT